MSGHSAACTRSSGLCDELYGALAKAIPALQCARSERWCGFYATGRRRFAYISHFKTRTRIEVWCRGDVSHLRKLAPPLVRARSKLSGGWSSEFPCRFELTEPAAVSAAVSLLVKGSFPSS